MKKILIAVITALVVLVATGCPSATLHNTPLSYVTLTVVNMPMPDGSYSFAGGFKDLGWNTAERLFDVVGGAGSYTTGSAIISSNLTFSICKEGTWERAFYPTTLGNSNDYGKMQNFIVTVPMDAGTHNITIDGSTATATITVE